MGANESRRPNRTPHLPRYVIEHIGQVLRNRLRGDLLVPVPGEMLDRLKGGETRSRCGRGTCGT